MARMEPLPVKEWPPAMRDALAAMPPPEARYVLTSQGRPSGFNVLGALAHHPRLARAFFALNAHLLLTTSLTERQRELVIMRVAALRRCTYEWAQHVFMARDAGLSDIEISWIAWGPDAPTWSTAEGLLLRAVDELLLGGVIGESTWAGLAGHLNGEEILDVIFTTGSYSMLASMLDSLGIELDDDLRSAIASITTPTDPTSQ